MTAAFFILLCLSCSKTEAIQSGEEINPKENTNEFYFDYSIDGKAFSVNEDDILTTYNEFGATQKEFKIFAGKDQERSLILTITSDMSKPSTTPNGSAEAGNPLSQGSVSLQN